ncbi:hypothetical protein QOZ88_11220 [Blastococcus sp. BMG 814]|uniref:GNAT family N-acetyltransferase n=1 Tax=Blastococcus carthaginiensis TaxID=3050034 RepID=A0ABT9ICB2_9ACTN|nr:hypothetical protein [Blastococcus carthaginiensis]MDP5183209.1 hypothetical protein [Blastococcus carthaginiensis]
MELPEVELRPLRRADRPLLARWPAETLVPVVAADEAPWRALAAGGHHLVRGG